MTREQWQEKLRRKRAPQRFQTYKYNTGFAYADVEFVDDCKKVFKRNNENFIDIYFEVFLKSGKVLRLGSTFEYPKRKVVKNFLGYKYITKVPVSSKWFENHDKNVLQAIKDQKTVLNRFRKWVNYSEQQ